jgi:ATP phosphoribosyltransferase regulatory subunit
VRDFLPRAAARRRSLAERVMEVFEAWGYARIITPIFECADVLERGLGAGARAAAIRFVEPGTGEVVALRPDITPQVARVVATRMTEVPGTIRLAYEGAVTRLAGELGQREILQAGIELVDAHEGGAHGLGGDAEVLAVACAALSRLELGETRLDVGHVAPARFVLNAAPDRDARAALVAAISRKDRAGVRRAARPLPAAVAPLAEALVTLWGPSLATLDRARALPWPEQVRKSFSEVASALEGLAALDGNREQNVTLDFGDLRGFDYYTGLRFAAYAHGAPDAILRGGRYDELIGRYGRPARATGFAIDLEAVAQAQRAVGIAVPGSALGVAISTDGGPQIARALRASGARAVIQIQVDGTWGAWLRGAGLDVALVGDRLIRSDDSERPAGEALQAARLGDTEPLIALIKA